MEYMNKEDSKSTVKNEKADRRFFYLLIKRIFDFVASFFGLIVLSPLFLIIAIAIKLESPKGNVFYSQTRLGKNQTPFRMYKFRSMEMNADQKLKDLLKDNEIDGAMFKMKNDPRVTKVGHFIRKYSIDELPQLINVLIGNMSLVGPRPPLPREVEKYSENEKRRLLVKPGCTGLWQVSGRNDIDFYGMVRIDLNYIENRSFYLDVKIIMKTVKIMLIPNAAY